MEDHKTKMAQVWPCNMCSKIWQALINLLQAYKQRVANDVHHADATRMDFHDTFVSLSLTRRCVHPAELRQALRNTNG